MTSNDRAWDIVAAAAERLSAPAGVDTVRRRIVDEAVDLVDGCTHAGLFLLDGDVVTTPASTDPLVDRLDLDQHAAEEGPCQEALRTGELQHIADVRTDARWPRFAALAAAVGCHGVLAVPLRDQHRPSAFNLYATVADAFDGRSMSVAVVLAIVSGMALTTAHVREDDDVVAAQKERAQDDHEVISLAQGILVERERITPAKAFDRLRVASQHRNVKLRVVARELVDTGEDPWVVNQ